MVSMISKGSARSVVDDCTPTKRLVDAFVSKRWPFPLCELKRDTLLVQLCPTSKWKKRKNSTGTNILPRIEDVYRVLIRSTK